MNSTSRTATMTQPQPWAVPAAAWTCRNLVPQLSDLANAFQPISLREMDEVALLDRFDTKFVMTTRQLAITLAELYNDYWMLEVNGLRLNLYRTLYFDTPAFDLYTAHANDRPERYKVRSREYADSHLSFFEVKHRTRKDRTIKERILTPQPVAEIAGGVRSWLGEVAPLDGSQLEPKLWNTFTRLTLVSKQCCERVTLDIDLAFSTEDRRVFLEGMVIAEVKMDRARRTSCFIEQMRRQRIKAQGFSKYATGVAMLYEGVKKNSLKPKLLLVEKMMKGLESYE